MPNQSIPRIVVVGASHAGVSFADRLRQHGFNGSITLIDRQKGGPLERPPLSKEFLLDKSDKINPIFLLKKSKWYKNNQVTLMHGVTVTRIDTASKLLTLTNGELIGFDKLVLATGASPRWLPKSDNISNVFVLRQPDDAIAIRKIAHSVKSAIVVGGGYIGLEVAATFRQMDLTVSVVEAAGRLLARVASPPLSNVLENLHNSHGVNLYTGTGVEKITEKRGNFSGVILTDGTILKGDMLIIGIGVTPDSDLAIKAGIETENSDGGAIIVDPSMQTSNPNIMAIGDVALKRGNVIRIESVHNAQDSASRAAAAIMGQNSPAFETPRFWSDQYDTSMQSVGVVPTNSEDVYQISRIGKREQSNSFWSYQGKKLIAVEAINDIENFILGTKCLDKNISPDPTLISDPAFDPMA